MVDMSKLVENVRAARSAYSSAKEALDVAEAELGSAVRDVVLAGYEEKGEPTGTISFTKDGFRFKAVTPKTVAWDQAGLRDLYASIGASNENPDEYIRVKYDVSEDKYTAWPESIRDAFLPFRTLKAGKVKLEIVED